VDRPDKEDVDEISEVVQSDRISVACLSPECASFPDVFSLCFITHHISCHARLLPLEDPADNLNYSNRETMTEDSNPNFNKELFLDAKMFGA